MSEAPIRRLPPMNALKAFDAAARNQSFVLAADELCITPSAVSHQIKGLEEYLGLTLFHRNKRQVALTAAGSQYQQSVRQALDEIEAATYRLTANPERDTVAISVAPSFLIRWLMPRMNRFQEQYPDVELQISASSGLIDFTKQNTDMAVYFGHGDWHDIEVHFLRHVLLVPVCSPALLNGRHPLNEPSDLRHHTLIHVSKRLYEWPEWLALAGIEYKGFSRGLQLSSGQLTTGAAEEGLGVALADSTLIYREIEQGKLIRPFDLQLDTHKSFYLVYQKRRPLSYGMTVFKEWMIAEMQERP